MSTPLILNRSNSLNGSSVSLFRPFGPKRVRTEKDSNRERSYDTNSYFT